MPIRLRDVHHAYSPGTPWERRVLAGVDLDINRGECLGLLGANGSGKTTLIRHLNGLLTPQRGSVRIGDRTIGPGDKMPRLLSGEVGMAFQFPERQLFAEKVFDDVAGGLKFGGVPPGEIDGRVKDALHRVGMDPGTYGNRSPFSLTWGEKRQVALAGVIALDTPRLVFDEPGAGLDPRGRRRVTGMIAELAEVEGRTVVVVSHHLDDIFRVAHRLAVIAEGKIAFQGSLAELCRTDISSWGLEWPPLTEFMKGCSRRWPGLRADVTTPEEAAATVRPLVEERGG